MDIVDIKDINAIAAGIARRAHAEQRDKAGQPYVGHLQRVASYVDPFDPAAIAVAWLHDVIEDQGYTVDDLTGAGIPVAVARAVDLLSRRPGQHPDDYYAAIRANSLAREGKEADLADNTDPARLAKLSEERRDRLRHKYAHAYAALGTDPGDGARRRERAAAHE